jgi:ribonuclease HI
VEPVPSLRSGQALSEAKGSVRPESDLLAIIEKKSILKVIFLRIYLNSKNIFKLVLQILKMDKLTIYTDGGARGNPGPAGVGVVIINENGNKIEEHSKYIGKATNNQAEYQAIILALQKAKVLKAKEVDCYLDSQLVVEQLSRKFKIKDKNLGSLFVKIWNLLLDFKKVNFYHIPRERNREADKLVNQAIDQGMES